MVEYFKKLSEESLLATLVWGEARGESFRGKIAVAYVVLNRCKKRKTKIHDEILRNIRTKSGKTIYQFSCFHPSDPNYSKMKSAHKTDEWKDCLAASRGVISGLFSDPTNGANHYWNPNVVTPKWSIGVDYKEIGNHRFIKL